VSISIKRDALLVLLEASISIWIVRARSRTLIKLSRRSRVRTEVRNLSRAFLVVARQRHKALPAAVFGHEALPSRLLIVCGTLAKGSLLRFVSRNMPERK
jgi:hypothetical protein